MYSPPCHAEANVLGFTLILGLFNYGFSSSEFIGLEICMSGSQGKNLCDCTAVLSLQVILLLHTHVY
jgi:hypothetical protein